MYGFIRNAGPRIGTVGTFIGMGYERILEFPFKPVQEELTIYMAIKRGNGVCDRGEIMNFRNEYYNVAKDQKERDTYITKYICHGCGQKFRKLYASGTFEVQCPYSD